MAWVFDTLRAVSSSPLVLTQSRGFVLVVPLFGMLVWMDVGSLPVQVPGGCHSLGICLPLALLLLLEALSLDRGWVQREGCGCTATQVGEFHRGPVLSTWALLWWELKTLGNMVL